MIRSSQSSADVNLRLLWPQWQGVGTVSVQQLAAEFPFDVGRRGYAVGSAVLEAVLPPHDGATATAPVTMTDEGLAEHDGIEAKAIVVKQLADALEVIRQHNPARITTFGGVLGERRAVLRARRPLRRGPCDRLDRLEP